VFCFVVVGFEKELSYETAKQNAENDIICTWFRMYGQRHSHAHHQSTKRYEQHFAINEDIDGNEVKNR
jgi:hypothetical protein